MFWEWLRFDGNQIFLCPLVSMSISFFSYEQPFGKANRITSTAVCGGEVFVNKQPIFFANQWLD
jgi:hypothetical protein